MAQDPDDPGEKGREKGAAGRSALASALSAARRVLGGGVRSPAPPAAAAPVPAPAAAPESAGLTVLVVEDDEVNRLMVRALLQRDGHRVREAPDGDSALRLAAGGGIDLVLMDIRLPGQGGMEVARRIRALPDPRAAGIPIVAMTSGLDEAKIARYRDVGMAEALAKPVTAEGLRAVLGRALSPVPASPGAEEDEAGLLNPDVLDGHREVLGAERVRGIVDSFLRSAPETVARLRQALEGGDLHAAARAAHKLGSGALTVGLPRLSALAYAVEKQGDAQDRAAIFQTAEDLAGCFTRSARALERYRQGLV
ncbi:MAG TPA: response regulator [Azospirillaceae bacterium]|nr:response regulator [Azospirillaceae bacterium]